jgi:hypothetical protein
VTSVIAGTGIGASTSVGAVTINNTGVTSIVAGSGITLTATGAGGTGAVTVNSAAGVTFYVSTGIAFANISTFYNTGVVSLAAGSNMSLTATTGAVTVNNIQNLYVSSLTGTSATLASTSYFYNYYITNSGFNTLNLPGTQDSSIGAYWGLNNQTNTYLSVALTGSGTGAGNALVSPMSMAPYTTTRIVTTGTAQPTTGYVLM